LTRRGWLGEITETIPASILGVHALLVGFTFSMSISRYESRRELVIKEANAIGTAYLRAKTLPAPFAQKSQDLLKTYLTQKVQFGKLVYGHEGIASTLKDIDQSHRELWSMAKDLTETSRTPIDALYLSALNDVIDLHSERMAALENQLPGTVLLLLLITLAIALFSLGFVEAAKKRQGNIWLVTLSMLFAIVITLIIDLDRPRRGWITVSQKPIHVLFESVASEANSR
jgi:hypothetical protein